MKLFTLSFLLSLGFASTSSAEVKTGDRTTYIITLASGLAMNQLDDCMESICNLSGNRATIECEILSKRFLIAAANLSNSASKKVKLLSCVKSLRAERSDFEAKPRSGRSN